MRKEWNVERGEAENGWGNIEYYLQLAGAWNVECRMCNVQIGILDIECGTWNVKYGLWNTEYVMWNVECESKMNWISVVTSWGVCYSIA